MSQDCPGFCNNRARRLQAAYKLAVDQWDQEVASLAEGDEPPPRPVPPDMRPWPGSPIWCLGCQGSLRTMLAELDDLAAHLSSLSGVLRGTADSGTRITTSRTHAPSPSPSMDDLDELAGWLRDWQCVAQGSEPLARRGYLASVITTSVLWLAAHFDSLIVNPDVAEDFGMEIRRWHRGLTEKTRTGAGLKHMKRPCPRCGMYTLWRQDGENYVRCRDEDCGRMLSLPEYEALDSDAVA